MANKKTAVDWFESELKKQGLLILPESWDDMAFYKNLREQANQMEKEQIKDAFDMGYSNYLFDGGGEQYYNETYNVKDN